VDEYFAGCQCSDSHFRCCEGHVIRSGVYSKGVGCQNTRRVLRPVKVFRRLSISPCYKRSAANGGDFDLVSATVLSVMLLAEKQDV